MKPGETGIKRLISATRYSLKGFRFAWINEAAFRQEIILCIFMLPLAIWIGGDATQRSLLIACCLLVLITELLNTGIEAVVDRIGHEYHDLAGSAKDLGSAAVLISLVLTVITWGLIIFERFFTA